MERSFFFLTIGWGFATAALYVLHGYKPVQFEFIPAFCCLAWSLLMLARINMLGAPKKRPFSQTEAKHWRLSTHLLNSLHARREDFNLLRLDLSFNKSFFLFVMMVLILGGWQALCLIFPQQTTQGLIESIQYLLHGEEAPNIKILLTFIWGQNFLVLLTLCLMAFVLRSLGSLREEIRLVSQILLAYIPAFYLFFLGFETMHTDDTSLGMTGTGGLFDPHLGDPVIDRLLSEWGIGGVFLMWLTGLIPMAAITLFGSVQKIDPLVLSSGIVAATCLILCTFLATIPALGGYVILCGMAAFLCWGATDLPPLNLKNNLKEP